MTFTKSSLFFVASLASASIILPACSDDKSSVMDKVGSLGLNLEAGGLVINEISYVITHGDSWTLPGTMDVSEKDIGLRIGGLPVKDGYTLNLTATTTTGENCTGSATFNVTENAVSPVTIELECKKGTPGAVGGVEVNGTVKVVDNGTGGYACSGAYVIASPYACPVGVDVALTSSDVVGADAAGLTYSWKDADGNEFSTEKNAAFPCATAGEYTISFKVSGENCVLEREVAVSCLDKDTGTDTTTTDTTTTTEPAAECGDGEKNQDSEECDDGNDVDTDACTNSCKNAVCGDGIVLEGVEECDGGDNCNADCTLKPGPKCGDGEKNQDSEECDDGNDVDTDACTNSCKNAVCGDGIVLEGVEECDGGDNCTADCKNAPRCGDGVVNQDSEECDSEDRTVCDENCKNVVTVDPKSYFSEGGTACEECAIEKCGAQYDACKASDTCVEIAKCEVEAKCLDAFLGPFTCLCGEGVKVPECQAVQDGAFTGACAEKILNNLETVGDTQQTFVRFANTDWDAGVAHQSLVCAGRFCAVECKDLIYNSPN